MNFTGGNSLISIITIEKNSFFSIFAKIIQKGGVASAKNRKKKLFFSIVIIEIKEFPPVKFTMEKHDFTN